MAVAAALSSCVESPSGRFDIHRLEGKWLRSGEQAQQIEEWMYNADNEIWGRGYQLFDKDTLYIEYLSIQPVNDTLSYLAKVRNENFGEIIRFPLYRQSDSMIEFFNPAHDFPNRITYQLKSDSVLYVLVEGLEDGKSRSIEYDFRKMTP